MRVPFGRMRALVAGWGPREWFYRLLGATFLVAFAQLLPQIRGLWGPDGIAPAAAFLSSARVLGASRFWEVPSLFWISASGPALLLGAWLGVAASLAVIRGVAPRWMLLACWALYLSFVSVGGIFLGYQWDTLLLEVGLLGAFYAPSGLRPDPSPSGRPQRLLLWLLLFVLMFSSGWVKLASGDRTWRSLTALTFHFWTQPLPNPIAYFVAHLPRWALEAMTFSALAIELVAPFLIFGPRPLRKVAFWALVGLQGLIFLTGNYGYFNLLTMVLCIPLLDDGGVKRGRTVEVPSEDAGEKAQVGMWLETRQGQPASGRFGSVVAGGWRQASAWAGASCLAVLCVLPGVSRAVPPLRAMGGVGSVLRAIRPWESFNAYGLFAVMTTERNEIQLEGSEDGRTWQPYLFADKPGPVGLAPSIVAPYQPRLDWQMWFAALGRCGGRGGWFFGFAKRLLQGSKPVLGLMEKVPFGGRPPRYLRTWIRPYRFAPLGSKDWWAEGPRRPWCPVLMLKDGRLAAARP